MGVDDVTRRRTSLGLRCWQIAGVAAVVAAPFLAADWAWHAWVWVVAR